MDTVFRADSEKRYILEKNNFPYYTFNGIEHHVLWINPDKMNSIQLNWSEIREIICQKLFDGDSGRMENYCVYFQNAVKFQSIRSIPLIHVFKLVN